MDKLDRLYKTLLQGKFIKNLQSSAVFFDEPPYHYYSLQLLHYPHKLSSDGYTVNTYKIATGGLSLVSAREALFKCLGEAVERLCLMSYRESDIVFGTYKAVSRNQHALDPALYLPDNKIDTTVFGWVKGYTITRSKRTSCLIPAQLVFINYLDTHKEPHMGHSISTGAAASGVMNEALYKGVCEVVERDAVMTAYLLRAKVPKIDTGTIPDEQVTRYRYKLAKFRLDWHLFAATNDIGVPSYLSLIVDKTGEGPFLTAGSAADFDELRAIKKSLEEAMMGRPLARIELIKGNRKWNNTFHSYKDRMLYWAQPSMEKKIDFLLEQREKSFSAAFSGSSSYSWRVLREKILKSGYQPYWADITLPVFRQCGYVVYKTLIPGLQPLYIDEKYARFFDQRLGRVGTFFGMRNKKINKTPHFFL